MSTNYHNQFLKICSILLIALAALSGCNRNPTGPGAINSRDPFGMSEPIPVSSKDADSAEPAMASAPDGTVYLAWIDHGPKGVADVMLVAFAGNGQMRGPAVRVNSQPGIATAWRGDPPTVAVAPDQTVFVGWTARVESNLGHANVLYLSASRDHGKTFSAPVKVNDDTKPAAHGMHSLAIANDGRVHMAWLDERNIAPMPAENMKTGAGTGGHHMESNRDLFFSFSTDGGRTFSANEAVATDVCPCCKTAQAIAPDSRVYLSWRQVLPGDFRHIAISSSADGGKSFTKPVIVSDDRWALHGCPVSGATLSAEADGRLRVLWFAGDENSQQGIYWSESQDGGKTFSPRELLAAGFAHGTPVLISDGQNPVAIWEASANGASEVKGAGFSSGHGPVTDHVIAGSGELPAAAAQNNHVLVAYVVKDGEKRSVWAVTIDGLKKGSKKHVLGSR